MKKTTLGMIGILVAGTVSIVNASDKVDPKQYMNVTIEKNISAEEIKAYVRDGKDMGIGVVVDPKFGCLDIGYAKSNLFEKGILHGTKNKDGNIEAGKKGDFKLYSFIKYFKDGASCTETTYAKGDRRYGKGTVAILMGKRK